MVKSCCAFGCTNRFLKSSNISFFRFPKNPARKKLWILALRRKNFEPSNFAVICSEHFQTGKPSKDLNHPDYVPSIFTFNLSKKSRKNKAELNRAANVVTNSSKINVEANFEYDTLEINEFTAVKGDALKLRTESNGSTKANTRKLQNVSEDDDEVLNLKLELLEAFTDIDTLRKENDMLISKLSSTKATQNILHKTISEKEEELLKVKKELQQAYSEVSALRMEKEELQNKLLAVNIAQGILQDTNKLHFYTGLNSTKDFNSILSLISDIENHVRCVPLETQLLIVLTKLKLDLLFSDLAYRYQTSSKTVHRICDIIIPPLEAKLDLLVKCPINTALKRNIPVGFKNTVFENLYQRLVKYSKSKLKQPEDAEEGTGFGIL